MIEVVKNSVTDGQVADWVAKNVKKSDADYVFYELTRSDWTRLVNPAETEDRRPGHRS